MKHKLISIIIPIYNAEKYLMDLLNSISNQIFLDFEVLLINDGSSDNSKEICLNFVSKDDRYKYYEKENTGVSDTRNYGITLATGKYICFIDADDLLTKDYLQTFVSNIVESNFKMISCNFHRFNDGESVNLDSNNLKNIEYKTYNNETKFDLLFSNGYGYLWNKLFIRDIIIDNNIKFSKDIYMCEDMLFVFEYLKHIDEVLFVNLENYKYRIISGSASKNLKNIKWFTLFKTFEILSSEKKIYNSKTFNRIMYGYEFYLYEAKYRLKFIKDNDNYLDIKSDINSRLKQIRDIDYKLTCKEKFKLFIYKYFNSLIFTIKKRGK